MNRQTPISKRGKRLCAIEIVVEGLFMTILCEPGRLDPVGKLAGLGTSRLALVVGAQLAPSVVSELL